MGDYTHFSKEERKKIYYYLEGKKPISEIAKDLCRHRSAVYREIQRNSYKDKYIGSIAEDIASERRRKSRKNKIRDNPELQKCILERLQDKWSPEQISGRLKLEQKGYYACHESIYRFIYQERELRWYEYLKSRHKRRYSPSGRHKQVRYSGGKSIHERSKDIENEFGHWEGDLIMFQGNRKTNITTLVERKSLYTLLAKNRDKTSKEVMEKIRILIKSSPKKYWKTLTFDQGGEFSDFRIIEGKTGCLVYYCDAKSPWQKGCNENTNGRLRRYLPKELDIEKITECDVAELINKINRIPRKKLGYLMPTEALELNFKLGCRT